MTKQLLKERIESILSNKPKGVNWCHVVYLTDIDDKQLLSELTPQQMNMDEYEKFRSITKVGIEQSCVRIFQGGCQRTYDDTKYDVLLFPYKLVFKSHNYMNFMHHDCEQVLHIVKSGFDSWFVFIEDVHETEPYKSGIEHLDENELFVRHGIQLTLPSIEENTVPSHPEATC